MSKLKRKPKEYYTKVRTQLLHAFTDGQLEQPCSIDDLYRFVNKKVSKKYISNWCKDMMLKDLLAIAKSKGEKNEPLYVFLDLEEFECEPEESGTKYAIEKLQAKLRQKADELNTLANDLDSLISDAEKFDKFIDFVDKMHL